jgi:hypothetical protein
MFRIKISCDGATIAKLNHDNILIQKFLPAWGNKWKNCEFFLNDESITKADYWVIAGDVSLDEEVCEVPAGNIIFMTGEPQSIRRYDTSPDFVKQFDRIFTSQHDFKHEKVFACRPPINWWIDGGSPIKSQQEFDEWDGGKFGYDDFKNLREIKKDKLLSVFCSNKIFTEGHKARFNFCQKIKTHFKDKVDWFGNGVRPIESKWDGIAPYKYHIALENFNGPDYWTEKLMDPLMALSHPIYCGATNIEKYFSADQISVIDIKYPRTAIAKIERLIDENFYEKNFNSLLAARDLVMDEYNFFNIISDIVESDVKQCGSGEKARLIKIKKEQFFLLQTAVPPTKSRKNLGQRLKKSLAKKSKKIHDFLVDYFLLVKFKISK